MRIPWTDKMTNEKVLQRAEMDRKLICEIRTKHNEVYGACSKKGWSGSLGINWKDPREEEQRKKEDALADKSK